MLFKIHVLAKISANGNSYLAVIAVVVCGSVDGTLG